MRPVPRGVLCLPSPGVLGKGTPHGPVSGVVGNRSAACPRNSRSSMLLMASVRQRSSTRALARSSPSRTNPHLSQQAMARVLHASTHWSTRWSPPSLGGGAAARGAPTEPQPCPHRSTTRMPMASHTRRSASFTSFTECRRIAPMAPPPKSVTQQCGSATACWGHRLASSGMMGAVRVGAPPYRRVSSASRPGAACRQHPRTLQRGADSAIRRTRARCSGANASATGDSAITSQGCGRQAAV